MTRKRKRRSIRVKAKKTKIFMRLLSTIHLAFLLPLMLVIPRLKVAIRAKAVRVRTL